MGPPASTPVNDTTRLPYDLDTTVAHIEQLGFTDGHGGAPPKGAPEKIQALAEQAWRLRIGHLQQELAREEQNAAVEEKLQTDAYTALEQVQTELLRKERDRNLRPGMYNRVLGWFL